MSREYCNKFTNTRIYVKRVLKLFCVLLIMLNRLVTLFYFEDKSVEILFVAVL